MGVTWSGCYIPSDEQYVTPSGTLERIVTQLAGLAEPSSQADETLDANGRIIFLQLTEEGRRRAWAWLFDEGQTYPTSIMVEEYGVPRPELDHPGQRLCGSCGALVPLGRSVSVVELSKTPRSG